MSTSSLPGWVPILITQCQVLIQQGLNSSIHDLDASAENFVRSGGAPAPNRWVNQQMLCSGVLKKSGLKLHISDKLFHFFAVVQGYASLCPPCFH